MTKFEHMRKTVLDTVAALDQEELRQLVADTSMDEGDNKAVFSCGICEEIYGECDTVFNGTACRERYFDWCSREYIPETDQGAIMEAVKRYGIPKDVIVLQ